jgi:FtsH-binding integral membrane protein
LNYLLLIVFTAFEAYMIAGFSASYMDLRVIVAGLGTALVIVSLTIYSRFTMEEVQVGPAIGSIICMALLPVLIVSIIIKTSLVYIIILMIILVLYSFFIVLDTIIICHSCKSMGG